jgi:hypothetical protein
MVCGTCGQTVIEGARYCGTCEAGLTGGKAASQSASQNTAPIAPPQKQYRFSGGALSVLIIGAICFLAGLQRALAYAELRASPPAWLMLMLIVSAVLILDGSYKIYSPR